MERGEMTDFWGQILDFAQTSTQELGQQLLLDFGQARASEKEDGSLVTASDEWMDRQLHQRIQATFPDHGFLSEESEHIFPNTDWCWIIDPIDGTTNFARGIPLWGTCLGLLYRGIPVFGYVHLPPIQQSFHGYWGEGLPESLQIPFGAYLNGQRIHTNPADSGPNQLFNFCSRSVDLITPDFPCKVRMLGGAAYNMLSVASGTFLGAVEGTPKIWDIAAVWAIVKAAGGVWLPLDDDQSPFPVIPGTDYGHRAYRTLVLSREALVPLFKPLMQRSSLDKS